MTELTPPRETALRSVGKRSLFRTFKWLGINAVARALHSRALPIICYHNVVREPVAGWMAVGGLHLPERHFIQQMEYVANHYRVVPLEDAWDRLARGDRLRDNSVALTFDDGYFSTVHVAAPVLSRLRLPATVFLSTDYIAGGGWYWWDELPAVITSALGRTVDVGEWGRFDLTTRPGVCRAVTEIADALRAAPLTKRREFFDAFADAARVRISRVPDSMRPMTWGEAASAPAVIRYGGHGASHRVLDLLQPAEILDDTRRCRAALDEHVGNRAGRAFCYPEGRVGEASPQCVREAGFTIGVTATSHPSAERMAERRSDPMQLPRIGVSAAMTFDVFVASLAGVRAILGV